MQRTRRDKKKKLYCVQRKKKQLAAAYNDNDCAAASNAATNNHYKEGKIETARNLKLLKFQQKQMKDSASINYDTIDGTKQIVHPIS